MFTGAARDSLHSLWVLGHAVAADGTTVKARGFGVVSGGCGGFLRGLGRVGTSGYPESWAQWAAGPRTAGSHGVKGRQGVPPGHVPQIPGPCWAVAWSQSWPQPWTARRPPAAHIGLTAPAPPDGVPAGRPHAHEGRAGCPVGAAAPPAPQFTRPAPGSPTAKSTPRAGSSSASKANQPPFS